MANELDTYRREIDALDDRIAELLKDRLAVVKKVGEYKKEHAPGFCPIRPGREAAMLRRIAQAFDGSVFSPAAAAQLWRIIIGTSTALESTLSISVYAPESNRDLFWLAREYFGPSAILTRQPHPKRVIGDVMDGSAAVGVIPTLASDTDNQWWSHLLQPGQNTPKIFAHLPFVYHHDTPRTLPAGLAFSRVQPEDSGDDVSLFVLQASHDVSQHKLQTGLAAANLEAQWITIGALVADQRHHLVELKGFVTPGHAAFTTFLSSMNGMIQQAWFLGAYAVPFSIAAEKS